jgi:TonB family protein
MISELSAIRRPFLCVILLLAASQTPNAQRPQDRAPAPPGQDIVAKDGDRIILEEDAQLQIVRRRSAMVRTIFNPAQRLLILLIDYPQKPGEAPDGSVDSMLSYFDVSGDWPLGERWEGLISVEEYTTAFGPHSTGLGLTTPAGVVKLRSDMGIAEPEHHDASVIAEMSYRGSSGAGGRIPAVSFDQAEQEQLAQAASQSGTGAVGFSSWSTSSGSVARGGMNVNPGVGGGTQKIRDVPPVYPDEARKANVSGVVVLEVTVGVDGAVTNPRVLRSIPLLDEAALAAVSQWQYQPVLMNGTPVPVVMTVAVPVGP